MTFFAVGCAGNERGEQDGGPSAPATPDDDETGGDDATERLDVEASGDGAVGDGGDSGCQKIDFLFVIDDSGSMYDFQQNLLESVPGFVAAIEENTNVADYHVMVVDTSIDSESKCVDVCEYGTWDISNCKDYIESCEALEQRDPCESVLGAGVTSPRGAYSSMDDCAIPEPRRYLDGNQDVLNDFACVAQVGTSGMGEERPYGAMAAALSPQGAVAECNDGFLRDDAILVVTILSDAGEDTTADVPYGANEAELLEQWQTALVGAKPQGEDAIVLMSFHYYEDGDANVACPVRVGVGSAFAPEAYRAFPPLLGEHGFEASICLGDYSQSFAGAVGTIAEVCEDFVPPG